METNRFRKEVGKNADLAVIDDSSNFVISAACKYQANNIKASPKYTGKQDFSNYKIIIY